MCPFSGGKLLFQIDVAWKVFQVAKKPSAVMQLELSFSKLSRLSAVCCLKSFRVPVKEVCVVVLVTSDPIGVGSRSFVGQGHTVPCGKKGF